MNFNAIENSSSSPNIAPKDAASPEALRRAAAQFEAILLMQLTSALNGSNADEDSLFGSDGGSSLAKQMFSEQLAATMADAGGIGLSDIIMQQFGAATAQPKATAVAGKLSNVLSAVRDIKASGVSGENKTAALINKNNRIQPVVNAFSGDPNDAEIISTYEDRVNVPSSQMSVKGGKYPASQFMPDLDAAASNYSAVSAANISVQMPVNGRISSNFGNRIHPIDKTMKFHAGIDIAAPKGTPIGSAAEGVVTFAGWRKGYGNLVIVEHPDGRTTRYGHAEKLFVNEGDIVSAGQKIASVGSTGKSTGPHLHFEVRENGAAVDPRDFLSNVLNQPADK